MAKRQKNSKTKTRADHSAGFGFFYSLEFLWRLDFGVWDFGIRAFLPA
jgi:hypothetical protein